MDKKLIERIALEVANTIAAPFASDECLARFSLEFLARIDAERGKEAVAWNYELEQVAFDRLSASGIKSDAPLFLSPTIPEGWALVKIEITDKGVEASGAECQSGKCAYDVAAELWADMLAAQGERNAD